MKKLLLALAGALTAVALLSGQTGIISPSPFLTEFDNSGRIVNNGCVWTYAAGGTTPIATYQDILFNAQNTNPIRTDSAGRFTAFLVMGTAYKFVFESSCTPPSHGTVYRTADNIGTGSASTLSTSLLFNPDNTYDIGQSGALRPRDLFTGRNVAVGGTLNVAGNTVLADNVELAGNPKWYRGRTSGATPHNIIGINASNAVEIDPDGQGTQISAATLVLGALSVGGGSQAMIAATDGAFTTHGATTLQVGKVTSGTNALIVGADTGATTLTNSTVKDGLVTFKHYAIGTSNVMLIGGESTASTNDIFVGGGFGGQNSATALHFYTGATATTPTGTERATLSSAGAWKWEAYGAGTLTTDASGNITAVSDERKKDLVGPFSAGLRDLLGVRPILFHYKPETGLDTGNVYAGFSAQNLLETVPEAVGRDSAGFYSVNTTPIIAALVTSVQELTAEIDELRAALGLPPKDRTPPPIIDAATRIVDSARAKSGGGSR